MNQKIIHILFSIFSALVAIMEFDMGLYLEGIAFVFVGMYAIGNLLLMYRKKTKPVEYIPLSSWTGSRQDGTSMLGFIKGDKLVSVQTVPDRAGDTDLTTLAPNGISFDFIVIFSAVVYKGDK